ncbi:MAG TPA: TonB-dependent receptor [Xanthobacteraceae bacterium]|nr:TonB-dependent receptor [Xanthobacteraceae bacterium]
MAVTLSAIPLFGAGAQQAPAPAATPEEELPTVTVEGESANALEASTGLSRLPGTIQDTPQTITVISQETMQQQGVTTLEQALRNVPGVTVAIGEGNGGLNGDQFRIRGFQAKGDIYIDGLRDFGVYVRDSFAYESVEVIKGPASESFGMGTTGGAINNTLKSAHLGDAYDFEGQFGNGPLYRGVIDLNKQITDTIAVRIVGMVNEQDVVDRDHVESNRAGLLGSVAFGLGTDQTLTLNYLYQHGDRTPDYGVPMVSSGPLYNPVAVGPGNPPPTRTGVNTRPVTQYGVPRDTFYGKETDKDITNVNMFTARYSKDVNDWLTVTNDTRFANYSREFATTIPECGSDNGTTAPNWADTCSGRFFAGDDPLVAFGGGNPGFDQSSWGMQNITTAIAKFTTGTWRHEVVGGVDLFYQDDRRTAISVLGNKQGTKEAGTGSTIENPIYENVTDYSLYLNELAKKKASSSDVGIFISDRVWLTEQWSVLGGVRWDSFSSSYRATDTATGSWNGGTSVNTDSDTDALSPKASVIWEPTPLQTYYVSWARSFSPQGAFVTNDAAPINANQVDLEPEENELWEAGLKLGLLGGRLGFSAAVFQIEKSNQAYSDPAGNDFVLGEDVRVRGVEFGLTGNITDAWVVQLAYAYLDGTITSSAAGTGNNAIPANYYVGNEAPYVSPNTASVWTTYELTKHLVDLPGTVLVGGGITYADGYYTNVNNIAYIPDSFTLDALLSYEYKNFRVALNGYNLSDELNYSAGFGNRAVPASGRTFTVTVGATF